MKKIKFLPILVLIFFASCKEDSFVEKSDTATPAKTEFATTEENICPPPCTSCPPPPTSLSLNVPANMSLATYSVANNIVTFTKSGLIGTITGSGTNRKWNPTFVVPSTSSWTEIKINSDVTLTGNILIKKTDFKVTGSSSLTSVIDGSKTPYTKGSRSLCSIRHDGNGTITIQKLQSRNPANFHLTGFSKATIDDVRIIENRNTYSTDGFHFARGATVDNSYIDTYDDVLYIGEVTKISNSTIYHNKNGAIFMASWGQKISDIGTGKTIAQNCKFIDNHVPANANDRYGHGVVGWSQKCWTGPQTATVEFIGCTFIGNPAKSGILRSEFVSFGRNGNTSKETSISGGTIKLIGAKCSWKSPIRYGDAVDKTKVSLLADPCVN